MSILTTSNRPSRISSEIEFNSDGKHVGLLRLPHSVHRSAYGWMPIPIACISPAAMAGMRTSPIDDGNQG